MLIKIITRIYPDLPGCQDVCCADPPKNCFTFFFMKVDLLFVKKTSIYKPNIVYNLVVLFFIFFADV